MTLTTREEIAQQLALLEQMQDVQQAIEDLADVEFKPGESGLIDIHVTCRDDGKGITFVHGLPPELLVFGLREMLRRMRAEAGAHAEVAA